MQFDQFSANLTALNQRNTWLTIAALGQTILLLVLTFTLLGRHDRIVVVPAGLSGESSISWESADSQYITSIATAYAVLVGSMNPRNANIVVDKISALSEPAFYLELRKKLLARAMSPGFNGSGISVTFTPTLAPIYERETNTVFIIGEETVYAAYGAPKASPFIYEINLKIVAGEPKIYGLITYPGQEPHTLKWKTEHPDKDKS
jgi:hypothetical protein